MSAAGGDAIINLNIQTIFDPLDILVGLLVGGIYNMRQTNIEGDIIKYK